MNMFDSFGSPFFSPEDEDDTLNGFFYPEEDSLDVMCLERVRNRYGIVCFVWCKRQLVDPDTWNPIKKGNKHTWKHATHKQHREKINVVHDRAGRKKAKAYIKRLAKGSSTYWKDKLDKAQRLLDIRKKAYQEMSDEAKAKVDAKNSGSQICLSVQTNMEKSICTMQNNYERAVEAEQHRDENPQWYVTEDAAVAKQEVEEESFDDDNDDDCFLDVREESRYDLVYDPYM